jgi:predicted O-methyltransferase YrrM
MTLLTSPLVGPLTEDWRETLDALARARGWPSSREPERLAAHVASLSRAYNAKGPSASLRTKDALGARLGFSFPRDVPKAAGAVRELIATGTLAMIPDRPLRILDLGAGLGASSWGVARALDSLAPPASGRRRIESTCIDDDAEALSLAVAIMRARRGHTASLLEVAIEPIHATVAQGLSQARGPFDLVLLGQVLSEVGAEEDPERFERHVSLVRSSLDRIASDGSVVIVEPALRDRTRHLHSVRDALLARSAERLTVFAPCVHEASCPALAAEGQWCHEDLDVDLPAWLLPVARAAGLRWEGLTFSYLVLRKDARSLRTLGAKLVSPAALVRVVSGAIRTKGKVEAFVCGEVEREGVRAVARVRAVRLDRHASASNRAWEDLARGDLLACDPPLDAGKPRVRSESGVIRVTPAPGGAESLCPPNPARST